MVIYDILKTGLKNIAVVQQDVVITVSTGDACDCTGSSFRKFQAVAKPARQFGHAMQI